MLRVRPPLPQPLSVAAFPVLSSKEVVDKALPIAWTIDLIILIYFLSILPILSISLATSLDL